MHFNVYDVFCSQCSQQNVSAGIPAIFRVMLRTIYFNTCTVHFYYFVK